MISVPRSELQKFLTVARRACDVSRGGTGPPVLFRQKREDLKLSCVTPAGAVEFRVDEGGRAATFALPFDAVKKCAGGSQQPVEFAVEDDRIIATWQDNGSARTETFDSVAADSFPRLPREFRSNAEILPALGEASHTVCKEAARYSLQHVQLQGKSGRVVATDAHQLFVQEGFDFPWDNDLLLPASSAFQCKDLGDQETTSIGRTKTHVFFTAGPWTLALPVQQGRFPDVTDLIPTEKKVKSQLRITDADARFAIDRLPELPSSDDEHEIVSLDLNGEVLIRAADENGGNPVELALSESSCTGKTLKFSTDRRFFRRALQLGFREIGLTGPDSPALCRDGQRTYLWALLDEHVAVPANNSQRIPSSSDESPSTPKPRKTKSRMTSNTQSQNGSANSENGGIDGLIEQAETVKTSLRETLNQVGTFISDLKRQKKQAKLVRSTLASLKQLQSLDA